MENSEDIVEVSDRPIRNNSEVERLLSIYDAISPGGDDAENLTVLLSYKNTWGYANRLANVVNHRQGKERSVYDSNKRELINSSYEEHVDISMDKKLDDLFVNVLNEYLSPLAIVPQGVNKSKKVINTCGACLIMLFKNNQLGIIPRLKLPDYAIPWIEKTFELIRSVQDDVMDEWIEYLIESNNEFLIDKMREIGNDFFIQTASDAICTYSKYLKGYTDKINDPDKTYEKFLELKAEFNKVTGTINQNKLYEIYGMTEDSFKNRRISIIEEFQVAFTRNNENLDLLKKLIYGD